AARRLERRVPQSAAPLGPELDHLRFRAFNVCLISEAAPSTLLDTLDIVGSQGHQGHGLLTPDLDQHLGKPPSPAHAPLVLPRRATGVLDSILLVKAIGAIDDALANDPW